jgi:hypothetical protein
MSSIPFEPAVLNQSSKRVQEIYVYWNCIRGERAMPSRSDFDPVDVPRHLAGILLIDVEGPREGGGGLYRYRVVGECEVASRGHNPTGRLVHEGFYGPSLDSVLSEYDFVLAHRAPLFAPLDFQDERGRWVSELSIILPLSEDGMSVSQLLVYSERRAEAT